MVEKSGFVPDQNCVQEKVQRIRQASKAQVVEIEIDPADCLSLPFDSHFACTICQLVIRNPQQCGECETLNCAKCLKKWLRKKKECPGCRKVYNPSKIGRFLLNTLNSSSFKCQNCDQAYIYQNQVAHLKVCEGLPLKCDCGSVLKGFEQFTRHLNEECGEVDGTCGTCSEKQNRAKMPLHSCVLHLLNKVSTMEKQIEELKKQNQILTEQLDQKYKTSENQNAFAKNAQLKNKAQTSTSSMEPNQGKNKHLIEDSDDENFQIYVKKDIKRYDFISQSEKKKLLNGAEDEENKKEYCPNFIQVPPLKYQEANCLAIKKTYVEGNRADYSLNEVQVFDKEFRLLGDKLIGKVTIIEGQNQLGFQLMYGRRQQIASKLAKMFNSTLEKISLKNIPSIEFLPVTFYVLESSKVGKSFTCLAEKRLDINSFKKWTCNNTNNQQIQLQDDPQKNSKVSNFRRRAADYVGENEMIDNLKALIASQILDEEVPNAFSHWTYAITKHERLICELQGVLENNVFYMTEPAIHTRRENLGSTDLGQGGQQDFFKSHSCTSLCKALGI